MTTAISPFVPQSIEEAEKLSKLLAQSPLMPDALKGKPGDVLVTIITGYELGLSPMQAIRGLHVIKGKAVMSADLTVALVKRSPECVSFRLVESSATKATYETERKGEGKTAYSFTIEMAQRAGLTGGDNWRKYPDAMLRARCATALARAVYPDLTLGVYDPDEARDFGAAAPEREINPLPTVTVEASPPVPAGPPPVGASKGARITAKLAAKVGRAEPPPPEPALSQEPHVEPVDDGEEIITPFQAFAALAREYGLTSAQLASRAKGVLGKTAGFSHEDIGALRTSLAAVPPKKE